MTSCFRRRWASRSLRQVPSSLERSEHSTQIASRKFSVFIYEDGFEYEIHEMKKKWNTKTKITGQISIVPSFYLTICRESPVAIQQDSSMTTTTPDSLKKFQMIRERLESLPDGGSGLQAEADNCVSKRDQIYNSVGDTRISQNTQHQEPVWHILLEIIILFHRLDLLPYRFHFIFHDCSHFVVMWSLFQMVGTDSELRNMNSTVRSLMDRADYRVGLRHTPT